MNAGLSASVPHVLVVDDHVAILEATTTPLRPTYRVHTPSTGHGASELLRTQFNPAIVLDVLL